MNSFRQIFVNPSWTRISLVFVIIWGLSIILFIFKFTNSNSTDDCTVLNQRMQSAADYIAKQEQINFELRNLVDDYISDPSFSKEKKNKFVENINNKLDISNGYNSNSEGPTAEYEHLRRRLYSNIQEFWSYVQSETKRLHPSGENGAREFLELAHEHKR